MTEAGSAGGMKGTASPSRRSGGGFLLHLHPPRVPAEALRFTRTWGLGGMALVLLGLLTLTGILLMLVYQPAPDEAYQSILTLRDEVPFGRWVRNIHHWSANAMVVVTVLHLLRVFFTGGFTGARRSNWWIGLGLLAAVLVSVFTGYLLPWDQLSYWAITICTGMLEYVPAIGPTLQNVARGGAEVGDAALGNFYTLHTGLVPVVVVVLLGFHFWRVRKARGVILPAVPANGPGGNRVPAYPDLVVREAAVALGLSAAILLSAVFVDAPLGAPANPGLSPNPAKAPWYFLGVQELLIHVPPLLAVVVLPVLAVVGLALLPNVSLDPFEEGVWFRSSGGRRACVFAALTAVLITPCTVLTGNWAAGSSQKALAALPAVLFIAAAAGGLIWLRRGTPVSKGVMAQAAFVFLFVSFTVLTVIGIWFRGPGMALVWPWGAS